MGRLFTGTFCQWKTSCLLNQGSCAAGVSMFKVLDRRAFHVVIWISLFTWITPVNKISFYFSSRPLLHFLCSSLSFFVCFGHWLSLWPRTLAQKWFHKTDACNTDINTSSCCFTHDGRLHPGLCWQTNKLVSLCKRRDPHKEVYMMPVQWVKPEKKWFCMTVLFFKNILMGVRPQEQQNISLKHSLVLMLIFFLE